MDNKKLKLVIGASMMVVILLLGLSSLGDVKYSSKDGLSYEEKKRDAKYLLDFLENTYPYFDEIEKENGQDILRNKNKIINSISKTSSDDAFYESISSLLRKFTHGTAEISYNWDYFGNNFTYVDKDLGLNSSSYRDKALKGKAKWEPIQTNYWQKAYTSGDVNFIYINGDYYVSISQNPQAHIGDKLISIEDIPVDEYIKQLPPDKLFKEYDYTYDKYICPFYINILKDKNTKKKITIKNVQGEEKEMVLLPYDENKPLLESGYSKISNSNYTEEQMNAMYKERESRPFLTPLLNGKIVALDFSASMDTNTYYNDLKKKEQLFAAIDKSSTLILDIRSGYEEAMLYDILDYISPKNIENFNYKVFKKNKVNDEFVLDYKSKVGHFVTDITSPLETLEKTYPLSNYYIFKEKTFEIKGRNKYGGKVFVLFDGSSYQSSSSELLKAIIDNNLANVISNSKHNLRDYQFFNLTSTILPNSNLIINVNNGKTVDENGVFIENIVFIPQVIIKKDTNKIIESLKRGEGTGIEINQIKQERYNDKDEYYQEVLKLIK